jgi:hypothetical protein
MRKLNIFLLVIIFIIISIIIYGYNSGSCQIYKIHDCNNDFCLYKEFQINLNKNLNHDIQFLLGKNEIQKRVTIKMYPENILNCAIPNKDGVTISTQNIYKYSPDIIHFYTKDLCKKVSSEIGLTLYPTDLSMPTSCAMLIYEKENDWINWHYDYNYYNGRFFTVLIPITNELTCTKFQFKNKDNEIISLNLTNNAVCFEGNYLYHRASKLCKNQKRVILSCQYVTDNSISIINKLRIKIKDFAYTGKI